MPIQNRVTEQNTIDIGKYLANPIRCGAEGDIQEAVAYPNNVYKVVDGRALIPTPSSPFSTTMIPLRAWRFPGPIDIFTMYATFSGMPAVQAVALPSLDYKILVGMGGVTEHVVTGSYTPPTKTQATDPDEMGLLVQYCGRMFDTIELHVFVDDPAANDQAVPPVFPRKLPFSIAMYAALDRGHCESKAQTGINGTISFVAETFMDPHDLVP